MTQKTNSKTIATSEMTQKLQPMAPAPAPKFAQTEAEPDTWVVAALYQFRAVENAEQLRDELLERAKAWGLCGTLIVASEGINGTVAGSRQSISELHSELLRLGFDDMEYKESWASQRPFKRLKVKLKPEIVTLGVPVAPRQRAGRYLDPEHWNALIADPDTVVIDTRNRYEYKAGTFQGALDPGTDSFREFPEWLEQHREELEGKKIAMFCTGGIRCEKSTSLLLQEGFEDVYHLKGGILRYLEHMPKERSLWEGECFVFDERVTVGHGLEEGSMSMCFSCGWPLSQAELESPDYEAGVSCEHCINDTTPEQKKAFRDRQIAITERKREAQQAAAQTVTGQAHQ